MGANPYSYGSLAERWSVDEATTISRLNAARIKLDHLKWSLDQLINTDDPTTVAMTLPVKSAVIVPDSVESGTDENAQRVINVDLDDPLQVWDLEAFKQQMIATSWYAELGAPPVHGAMWVNQAQDKIIWWDREVGSIYMEFDAGNTDLAQTGSLVGIVFLDGVLYIASGAGGAVRADLLGDSSDLYKTNGHNVYGGNISERNAGAGYLVYNASPAIINNTVYEIAACRDPELLDEFGRPKHWWYVGTDGGSSVFSPVADAIYDSSATTDNLHGLCTPDGELIYITSSGVKDTAALKRSIFTISADAWVNDEGWNNAGTDAEELDWTNAAVFERPAVLPGRSWAGVGSPQVWIASNQGMYIAHANATDNAGQGGLIRLHQDYASPYQKGDTRAAWPLHAVTDASPAGHDLTNNNAVTFNAGGPTGNYADFVAASSMSLTLADHADFGGMSELTVGCWIYRDIDSGALEGLISKWDQGADDDSFILAVGAADTIAFTTDTSAGEVASVGPAIALATWYHIVATWDGATQKLYVNGDLVDSDAQTGTIDDSAEILTIGGASDTDTPQDFFDGRIAGVVISATVMTQTEIHAEYQRGLRTLTSTVDANGTISDNDVAGLQADPHGRYVIATFDNGNVYVFDEFGVPVYEDALAAGTLRDAAVKSYPGQDDPSWIMGGSTTVELVQPDRRILG